MRFVDWLFDRVFLPRKREWARTRVQQLVSEQQSVYERFMAEVERTEDAVRERRRDE
jgi:hypothetical protein